MSKQSLLVSGPSARRLAVLIDSDNARAVLIEAMLVEASKYGSATIRRAYGDWTTPDMNRWKQTLQIHAIQPIQQFRYTIGKNATDSALIIDAMDILHSGVVDGFCIISSDSDFTRLAMRIREGGFFVMGIGRKQTPRSLVSACEVFVFTELLEVGKSLNAGETSIPKDSSVDAGGKMPVNVGVQSTSAISGNCGEPFASSTSTSTVQDAGVIIQGGVKAAVPLLRKAYEVVTETTASTDGWTHLGAIGQVLLRNDPGFDSRSYGFKRLSLLVKALSDDFEVREVRASGDGAATLLIRPKVEQPVG